MLVRVHRQILIEELTSIAAGCNLAVLVDGDEEGKRRLRDLKAVLDMKSISSRQLSTGTSIEDHLPFLRTLYVQAVADYSHKLGVDNGDLKENDRGKLRQDFQSEFDKKFQEPGNEVNVSGWAAEVGSRLYSGKLPENSSKVGIAREYVNLLLGLYESISPDKIDNKELKRSISLAQWIGKTLELPSRIALERMLSE